MELRGTYTNKETVINERQHRIELYSMLLFTLNQEKYMEERQEAKDSYYAGRLLKKVKEGKAKTVKEALLQIEAEDEGLPVYRRFADTIDEAVDFFAKSYYAPGEHFVDTREPAVRQAYKKYIASTLIVGLRGRWLNGSWWRLADWGFSCTPFNEKEESVAFPYRTYEEMEGTDRDAFNMLVEEYYSLCEETIYARMALDKIVKAGEDITPEYPTYPLEGLSVEDILQDYNGRLTEEDLYDSWDAEIMLYAPMLVSRFGEAMYYALKYQGNEYKTYIESLNVAEDWDNAYKDNPESTYAKIMEE